MEIMQYLLDIYNQYHEEIIMFFVMVLSLILLILFSNKLIFPYIQHYITRYYPEYEKVLEQYSIYRYLAHSLLSFYFIFWGNILEISPLATNLIINIKNIITILYVSTSVTMLLISIVNGISDIYQNKITVHTKSSPMGLYNQILKVFITFIAIIITISTLLNISLGAFFTSLGAAAALLTFIFKDAILGLLASLQLTFQDIIRIGDWITIPQYNVEGNVEKITITAIKIRNFDQTISTIPTYSLLTTNVTNWRGINEKNARRIQRSIYIDIDTIKFCSDSLLESLKQSVYIPSNILEKMCLDSVKVNDITNIKMFRIYVQEYLKNNPFIYQQDFVFLIRQLAPTNNGLPLELYIFTKATKLVQYENIQADIFDHLFAIIPEFNLKIFQSNHFFQSGSK